MSDEEVRKVALDILQNRIWTDQHCGSLRNTELSFPILGMMDQEQLQKMTDEKITMIYEYMSKAGPLSCNGMPMFFSCRTANEVDAERIWAKYEEMKEALDKV